MNKLSALSLEAASYQRHSLHRMERAWVETNCYADLWIEVLHALGVEPMACLGFTLAVDFEGDQWTFFKPSHPELEKLYGVDVQELNIWRSLVDHAAEQLERGRLVLAEVDAFYLPDTSGTDFQQQHTKTTIAIESLDLAGRKLGYFHNAGYFELGPEQFAPLFHLETAPPPGFLPPYVEFVKTGALQKLPNPELARRSLALLPGHLARAPKNNPVTAFGARLEDQLGKVRRQEWPNYHLYAFATLRQLGAAFELASHYLIWLEGQGEGGLKKIATDLDLISTTAKAMILKAARAVTTGKPADFAPMLATMGTAWESSLAALRERYPG